MKCLNPKWRREQYGLPLPLDLVAIIQSYYDVMFPTRVIHVNQKFLGILDNDVYELQRVEACGEYRFRVLKNSRATPVVIAFSFHFIIEHVRKDWILIAGMTSCVIWNTKTDQVKHLNTATYARAYESQVYYIPPIPDHLYEYNLDFDHDRVIDHRRVTDLNVIENSLSICVYSDEYSTCLYKGVEHKGEGVMIEYDDHVYFIGRQSLECDSKQVVEFKERPTDVGLFEDVLFIVFQIHAVTYHLRTGEMHVIDDIPFNLQITSEHLHCQYHNTVHIYE